MRSGGNGRKVARVWWVYYFANQDWRRRMRKRLMTEDEAIEMAVEMKRKGEWSCPEIYDPYGNAVHGWGPR